MIIKDCDQQNIETAMAPLAPLLRSPLSVVKLTNFGISQ